MQVKEIDSDVLILGGGIAGCGAAYEARHWGKNLRIIVVEKANIDRSGAAAMGFPAINTYLGSSWGENSPDDFVRFARGDLMGMIREDLVYDIARHVDSSVQLLEEWGLPIIRDEKTGRYVRDGRWRILVNGESLKPLIAEAAKKSSTQIWNRVMITHLLTDSRKKNRIAGAMGFDVRYGSILVFRSKAVILATGGASHIFRPRAVGEGWGRTWYSPWNTGSAYALPIQAGAKMVQMEIRLVAARFKDAYGSADTWYLPPNSTVTNASGKRYESSSKRLLTAYGKYAETKPLPTCLRNHLMLEQVKKGQAPILVCTDRAFRALGKRLETPQTELGLTMEQAAFWASQNTNPRSTPAEIVLTEPFVMGSSAVNAGAWVSGPSDVAPDEYQWGWNRMTTISGLFAAGDAAGGAAHKFSSGSFAEGRIAGKAAVKYVMDSDGRKPRLDHNMVDKLKEDIFRPMENYETGQQFVTRGTDSPYSLNPTEGLKRLEKIMDEYVGGVSSMYATNAVGMSRGMDQINLLKQDLELLGAEDIHQLLRAWELIHRTITAESVLRHTMYREETRWPGYYYRSDFPRIDDENWKVFVLSELNNETGKWSFERAPIIPILND